MELLHRPVAWELDLLLGRKASGGNPQPLLFFSLARSEMGSHAGKRMCLNGAVLRDEYCSREKDIALLVRCKSLKSDAKMLA